MAGVFASAKKNNNALALLLLVNTKSIYEWLDAPLVIPSRDSRLQLATGIIKKSQIKSFVCVFCAIVFVCVSPPSQPLALINTEIYVLSAC